MEDIASIKIGDKTLAFSTNSYTVTPLFFPSGNIGELAINGTVNDLANEGKLLAFKKETDAEIILQKIKTNKYGKEAAIIGEVTDCYILKLIQHPFRSFVS